MKDADMNLWDDLPDGLPDMVPIAAAGQNFLYASMPKVARGLNVFGGATVWVYLLQQARMQKKKTILVPNSGLSKLGVDRFLKARALRKLERAGLIRVRRRVGCAPEVTLLDL
jgi:hypothetical protein